MYNRCMLKDIMTGSWKTNPKQFSTSLVFLKMNKFIVAPRMFLFLQAQLNDMLKNKVDFMRPL